MRSTLIDQRNARPSAERARGSADRRPPGRAATALRVPPLQRLFQRRRQVAAQLVQRATPARRGRRRCGSVKRLQLAAASAPSFSNAPRAAASIAAASLRRRERPGQRPPTRPSTRPAQHAAGRGQLVGGQRQLDVDRPAACGTGPAWAGRGDTAASPPATTSSRPARRPAVGGWSRGRPTSTSDPAGASNTSCRLPCGPASRSHSRSTAKPNGLPSTGRSICKPSCRLQGAARAEAQPRLARSPQRPPRPGRSACRDGRRCRGRRPPCPCATARTAASTAG